MENNKAVITTKYIVEKKSPVLSVYHDLDDDWQFIGPEAVTEEDAMVISLEQILIIDPSVEETLKIGLGFSAHRKSKTDKWKVVRDE